MKLLLPLIILSSVVLADPNKKMIVTIDDFSRGSNYLGRAKKNKLILKHLKDHGANGSIFFINCSSIDKSEKINKSYQNLISNGHILGNHTYFHKDLKKVSIQEYQEDISNCQKKIKEKFSYTMKYFRYPYLRRGDQKKYQAMTKYLKDNKYVDGFVTVDSSEWYLSGLLEDAIRKKKKVDFDKLGDFYVMTMMDSVNFYHKRAKELKLKKFAHSLLIHDNDLSALYLGKLLKRLKQEGWTFISAKEMYSAKNELNREIKNHNHGQGRVIATLEERGIKGPRNASWQPIKKIKAEVERLKIFQ